MRKIIGVLILAGLAAAGWPAGAARAEVVIKVRALNPLDTEQTAVIHYPLPVEISPDDILRQKAAYSMERGEGEEPRKTDFRVSLDEETGGYFIDDEVVLLPKEVVTLEVHVRDIWVIDTARIDGLRREAAGLFEEWEARTAALPETEPAGGGTGEEGGAPEESRAQETKEIVLTLRDEILDGLDQIEKRQDANRIVKVGVERHMSAHAENQEALRQVQQDILMLRSLIEVSGEEGDEGESEESEGAQDIGQ